MRRKRKKNERGLVKMKMWLKPCCSMPYNLKDLVSITKQPVVRIAYEIHDVQHPGWGGGALLIMAYMERLPPNGASFSGVRYMKG